MAGINPVHTHYHDRDRRSSSGSVIGQTYLFLPLVLLLNSMAEVGHLFMHDRHWMQFPDQMGFPLSMEMHPVGQSLTHLPHPSHEEDTEKPSQSMLNL